MDSIRVMVIDDHPIVREGVRSLLSNYADLKVVGEAESGRSALDCVGELSPDVILLDIRMPGESGVDVLKQLRHIAPSARVLMLTSFNDDEYITGALRADAHGYILKNASDETLTSAIRAVYHGERVLSPQVMERVMQHIGEDSELANGNTIEADERHILRLLAEGASNAKIAGELYMSEATIKRKLQEIFEKMAVHSRAQAAAEAVRRGLI